MLGFKHGYRIWIKVKNHWVIQFQDKLRYSFFDKWDIQNSWASNTMYVYMYVTQKHSNKYNIGSGVTLCEVTPLYNFSFKRVFGQLNCWITLSSYTQDTCKISRLSEINNYLIIKCLYFKFINFKLTHKKWAYESNGK